MLTREQIGASLRSAILWLFIASLGILVGVEAVYIAVFAGTEDFNAAYDNPSLQQIGGATALYPVCAATGSFMALFLVHLLPEITLLTISVYLWLTGYLIGSLKVGQMDVLMGCRAIKGIAIGIMTSVIPLYTEKAANDRQRAAHMLTLLQATVPLGILFMALVGRLAKNLSVSHRWLVAAAPAFTAPLFVLYLPMGAGFFTVIRQGDEKAQNLNWLQRTFADFRRLSQSHDATVRCVAATLAQCAGPLTAVNVIFYYSASLAEILGLSSHDAGFLSIGLYVCNFIGTAISLAFINKMPRLRTIRYTMLGLAMIHGVLFNVRLVHVVEKTRFELGSVAIGMLVLFVLVFSLTFAGISLVYTSEVVPPKTRSVSIGIATSAGWLVNFVVAMASVELLPLMGPHIFLLFSYICCGLFVAFSAMPEPVARAKQPASTEW